MARPIHNPRNIPDDVEDRMLCPMCRTVFLATDDERSGEFCSDDCDSEAAYEDQAHDDDLIDGVGFADPGGNSALRAATHDNPRNLPCPICHAPDRLTPIDRARGYQCDSCADALERGGF